MQVAWTTYRRMWQATLRAYPWTYFVAAFLGGILTIGLAALAYRSIGGGQVDKEFVAGTGSADYVGFVTVGAATYMFTVRLLLWTGKALITEQREGTLKSLIIAPTSRVPYLIGFGAFAVTSSLGEVTFLAMFAVAIGVTFPAMSLGAVVISFLTAVMAGFGLSVVLCSVMLATRETHITQNTLFIVVALVSGFTFPRTYLPMPLQWLAEIIPVTAALDCIRGAVSRSATLGELAPRLMITCALSLVYVVVGLKMLPMAERRAVEREG